MELTGLSSFVRNINKLSRAWNQTTIQKIGCLRLFFEISTSIDYVDKGGTNTGSHYASLVVPLKTEFHEKHSGFFHQKVLFHHNNAPVHSSLVVVAELMDGFIPPLLSRFGSLNYYLYPNINKWVGSWQGTDFNQTMM